MKKPESFIKINASDNVAVALTPLKKGGEYCGAVLAADIAEGHKFALTAIKKGGAVIKYGCVIGNATADIAAGEHVHTHNTATTLNEKKEYVYNKINADSPKTAEKRTVNVYERADGQIGIRNELWVVPTVGCVNAQARAIVQGFIKECGLKGVDDVFAFSHPYGCSQTGEDHERTKNILLNIVRHPNAGGVLVLGLGCENNRLSDFMAALGEYDASRIKFLSAQDEGDEVGRGIALLKEIYKTAKNDKRVKRDFSCLKIGLKCGGSDGLSGITANPLVGMVSDYLTAAGGTSVLTEVPEMFGAEELLMSRAKDRAVFDKTVALINGFKDYFLSHGQTVYENPSPGNKEGGITTLEDKSLGCTQKGGRGEVKDVLEDGQTITCGGLNLLNGPGNDMVAVTNLGAAGCHAVLFTTGRGTPFGGFVPTIKIATNDGLSAKKPGWIDYNAGRVLTEGFDKALEELLDLVTETANGKKAKNELNGSKEIAIFKTGITL